MKNNVVFFDIDGTIYDYEKGIPESAIYAINKIREKGALAIINTGRTKVMIFDEIMEIGFDGVIAGGGTYVEFNGKVLDDYNLLSSDARDLVNGLREHGFIPVPEGRDFLYFDEHELNEEFRQIYNIYKDRIPDKIKPIRFDSMKVSKVSGRFTQSSRLEALSDRFCDKYNVINHENRLVEVIPALYSKAVGIQTLMKHLGDENITTYAFGDSYNDLEMLKYVEYGILMGNADPRLKKLISLHTTDMFEDGILKGLVNYGLM